MLTHEEGLMNLYSLMTVLLYPVLIIDEISHQKRLMVSGAILISSAVSQRMCKAYRSNLSRLDYAHIAFFLTAASQLRAVTILWHNYA